jgi:hypothetical protein
LAPPYRWCTATEPRVGRLWEPLIMGLLTGTLYHNEPVSESVIGIASA